MIRGIVGRAGDPVLIWGGSGGLGSMAIQLIAASGGNAIAVISEEDKRDFVMSLGAKGAINRKEFGLTWNKAASLPTKS